MNLARKMKRRGVLSVMAKADGTILGVKSVDGWWQKRKDAAATVHAKKLKEK